MRKLLLNSSLFILGAIFLFSFFPLKDLLIEEWRNEKYGVEVIIFKKDNLYYGNVTEAGNEKGNEKLKKGPMQVLKNFKKTSDSTYCCGSIYLPKVGINISSNILMNNSKTLTVTEYILGIKTESNWNRIE